MKLPRKERQNEGPNTARDRMYDEEEYISSREMVLAREMK